jgi:hypothetical protein
MFRKTEDKQCLFGFCHKSASVALLFPVKEQECALQVYDSPIRRCVRRNGPKWLVAIVSSNPSSVVLGPNMCAVPALCTSTLSLVSVRLMSLAKSRIDLREAKSNFFTNTSWFPVLCTISSENSELSLYRTHLHEYSLSVQREALDCYYVTAT